MCYNNKCNWCDKRKPNTVKFKGYHKYMNMIICEECFNKKWPSVSYDKTKTRIL